MGTVYGYTVLLFARSYSSLRANNGNTLRGKKVFAHSAVTPPKVNGFGRNLEHCEDIVGGWPWQILGAIRAVETVREAAEIIFSVRTILPFPVGTFH